MERPTREISIIGIVLFALATVIFLSFNVFSLGKSVSNEGTLNTQSVLNDFSNIETNQFNDAVVTGRDVISFYKNQENKNIALLINLKTFEKGGSKFSNERTVFGIDNKIYVNYNVILESSLYENNKISKDTSLTYTENDGVVLKDGLVYLDYFIKLDTNGKAVFDCAVSNWTRKGTLEYIDTNSKFVSNLIYDESGILLGVLFTQI